MSTKSSENTNVLFAPGDVVQLRSGGPLNTVVSVYDGNANVIYYNSLSGLYEKFATSQACLRNAHSQPEVPRDANVLRSTSVAKSSLK